MSTQHTYHLIINKAEREKLYRYVSGNSAPTSDYDCYVLYFKVDSFVIKYLEDWDLWSEPQWPRKDVWSQLTPDGRAEIGCIHLLEKTISETEISFSFFPVSYDVSLLFRDSLSVREWFIQLSEITSATMTYLSLENEGHRIVYYRGEIIDVGLKGERHLELGASKFVDVMTSFADYCNQFHFYRDEFDSEDQRTNLF